MSVPVTTVPLPLAANDTVDPQPRASAIDRRRSVTHERVERATQLVEPRARGDADRHDRGVGQERAGEAIADVELLQLPPLVVDEVDLGEGDDPVADTDQFEDAQVLLALRLPPLGGGDHEHAGVDAAHAGQHVAQEPDVAGHVDEADALTARKGGVGEAEIDGQPATAFLLEAVGVGAGQRLDQRRLAVVDVTGGGDYTHRRSAAATAPSLPGSTVRRSSRVDPSRVRAMTGGLHDRRTASWSPAMRMPTDGNGAARCRAGAGDRLHRFDLTDAGSGEDLRGTGL